MILFDRKAAVTVGKRGAPGTRVSGLRIIFEVIKTSDSSSNKAKITVYNLSKKHQVELQGKDMVVILDVGYGTSIDQLYIGDITNAMTGRSGPDWLTIIDAGDGQYSFDNAVIDKSYAPNTTYSTIVKDVVGRFKEAGQVIVDSVYQRIGKETERTQSGISLSGTAKDIMDSLMGKLGYDWSIQDNEVQILKPSEDTGEEAVLLSPSSGLIGSPEIHTDKEKIIINALIQTTKLRPGRLVQITSRSVNGVYKVETAKYTGDTHGLNWYVTCEVIEK